MVCVAGQKVRSSAIDRGEKNGKVLFGDSNTPR